VTKTKQVFISYATVDAQFAHRLADNLRRLSVPVWIAPESIRPGEGWVEAIERGLAESSHMVVLLTPAALESEWVRKETDVAIAQERRGRIRVIPLDVEPCEVPLLLSSYQMVSFRRDYDAGLSQLVDILGVSVTPSQLVPPTVVERLQPFEPEMILIPAGEFLMGSDPNKDKGARDNEQPQHTLYLSDYYLAKTPVTNAQYAAFVQATGQYLPRYWKGGKPPVDKWGHPVRSVSWEAAVRFCHWLSEVTGKSYRLPSEAEWEKAARGTDGRIYPWGNAPNKDLLNVYGEVGDITVVGSYPMGASPYGVLDMAGNVWEWTRSIYRGYPYDPTDGREDPTMWDELVVRGGSWYRLQWYGRCAYRSKYWGFEDYYYRGFRVAMSPGSP